MSLEAATRDEVARVLGRAAFGARPGEVEQWAGRPYAELVNSLIDIPPLGSRGAASDETRRGVAQETGKGQSSESGGAIAQAQFWWLERMRTTAYPLEERMTLFWHGHFATAVRDPFPDVAMMMVQNQTLRQHALGNFRDLVAAMTIDPAMLEWLDGTRSTIPTPNENYAREFFELFTLGKYPQVHSEDDVREAARAFTGWNVERLFRSVNFDGRFHDKGSKSILGTTIVNSDANEYRAVVDIALRQAVSARFIAYKLVANFAYVPAGTDLLGAADPLVVAVADRLRATNWNIREAMRTLLMSDAFRLGDAGKGQQLVRQPVEVVVAAGKALNFALDRAEVVGQLNRMGQQLFAPPNVGGWPMGTAWLSPGTTLGRYDFGVVAQALATAAVPASSDFDGWARLLGIAAPTEASLAALRLFLSDQSNAAEPVRQAGVLVLLLSSPEWAVV